LSLRGRLLVAVGTAALAALVVADLIIYSALRSFLYGRADESLDASYKAVEQALEAQGPSGQTAFAAVVPGTYVELRTPSGAVSNRTAASRRGAPAATPELPDRIDIPPPSPGPDPPAVYLTVDGAEADAPPFRVRASRLRTGYQLVLAIPLDDTVATLRRLGGIEVAVTASALVGAVALGWWLVRVGLRPLEDVERTAGEIAAGQLDRRVPGEDTKTEVGRLARALNTMLKRIEDAFAERDATEAQLRRSEERLRRFVADASHELRTPLAAVSAYAELFGRGASDHPEDLPRVMSGIQTETARMGDLVEDLLLLARLDEGRPLERKPVEVVSLAAESVEAARAVGPAWPLDLDADEPVEVTGDAARLRQVLDNLLANVRAHTPPGTEARVRVGVEGESVVLQVADNGPGLTPEQANRVFERFYRADPSRSRLHGGTGLGLAIVAAIIAAHGGEVSASNGATGGATFTVRLPRTTSSGRLAAAAADG
jgi:two-component system OmpR family sensor kinase